MTIAHSFARRIAFDRLRRAGVPVVWNLAGGYQIEPDGSIPRVLEIHDNTAMECVRAFGIATVMGEGKGRASWT